MSWKVYLLVLLGGGLGSTLRFLMGKSVPFDASSFAWGTFAVNMLGCFLIGLLWVKLQQPVTKAFWIAGFLGGITTFSGLGLETFRYVHEKNVSMAFVYVFTSITFGIFLVWLGQKIVS